MGKKKTIISKTELLQQNEVDSLYKKAVFYIDQARLNVQCLRELSVRLNKKYGMGFSISTLKDIRQFYGTYSDQIGHALRGQSIPALSSNLGWIHYRSLMRVGRTEARQFTKLKPKKITGVVEN